MRIRIFRLLVCLLVICALLINLSPIRAEATAAGAVGIAKASVVTGNPYLIAGAALVTLGVYAASESGAFENLVDNAVSYLDSAGSWIADGSMQLLQTVTEAGQTAYYVAGDLLETLRSWLFNEKVLSSTFASTHSFLYDYPGQGLIDATVSTSTPTYIGSGQVGTRYLTLVWGTEPFSFEYLNSSGSSSGPYNGYYYTFFGISSSSYSDVIELSLGSYPSAYAGNQVVAAQYLIDYGISSAPSYSSSYDLTLGNVSSVPIDGTSARTWAPDVADRNGLYVKYNNDPEPPDDNNGKWFWRLALPLTIAELIAMSQADEWTGETPEEFPAGDTVTEFEILDRPEIDGYQGIEVSPVTNPDTNPDTGEGADPTEPGEPTEPSEGGSGDSSGGSETNWFQKIWKSIEELPNKFKTRFSDLKTAIEELPSKLKSLGTEIITAIQNLPQTFANLFNDIVTSVQTGIQAIKDFFTINAGDLTLTVTWTDFFPFCIPSDIKAFVEVFEAEPEAPHFVFDVNFPYMNEPWHIDLDFSPWDPVALVLRRLELLLFIVGLAMATRNYYIGG